MPRLGGAGMLALLMIVAAVREDAPLTRLLGAEILFQWELLEGRDDEVRRGAIRPLTLPALALAREGEGTKRHQLGIEEQHAMGPLRPHDTALPMMERFGGGGMPTSALWERPIHDQRHLPGQLSQLWPGWGHGLGGLRGEPLQRLACDRALSLPHLRAWGLGQSGTPGGFRERLVRGHAHQP
jgi:hypothetical protein